MTTYAGRDELAEYQEVEARIDAIYAEQRQLLKDLFAKRDELLKVLADRDYHLPKRRNQTETQAKIQRCPRCRDKLV